MRYTHTRMRTRSLLLIDDARHLAVKKTTRMGAREGGRQEEGREEGMRKGERRMARGRVRGEWAVGCESEDGFRHFL